LLEYPEEFSFGFMNLGNCSSAENKATTRNLRTDHRGQKGRPSCCSSTKAYILNVTQFSQAVGIPEAARNLIILPLSSEGELYTSCEMKWILSIMIIDTIQTCMHAVKVL
jgi:hypothetical protein